MMRKLVTMREALSDPGYFGGLLAGESWRAWRVLLISIVGEELTEDERVIFKGLTDREREPLEPVEEFAGVIGRRGGKTRAMAVLAAYLAACVDHRRVLAPGERGILPILAANTAQASTAFNYVSGIFAQSPNLRGLVERETVDTIELSSRVNISVRPASFRTVRGVTCVGAICDEIAFWYFDGANPDKEILRALRPALATTGGPLILISSPHAKRGELYGAVRRHFEPNGHPLILVAKAPSRMMNPSLSQQVVDRANEEDPEAASAEYLAEFRGDLEAFVSREAIEACISTGLAVRAPVAGTRYLGFCDPSGGSADSMTLAIAHLEGKRAALDCVTEKRPPFSPDAVTAEFAATLRCYGVTTIHADRYGGDWPTERFAVHGIKCEPAEMTRSELYLAFLPLVNSARVDLLDHPKMTAQFVGLERRVARSGKDSVDHAPNSHDDIANSVAGVCVLAAARPAGFVVTEAFVNQFAALCRQERQRAFEYDQDWGHYRR
jgi:hypothetical protein